MRESYLFICISMCLLLASCQSRDPEPPQVAVGASARQIFESRSSALPNTKSTDLSDIVRPMPADIVPLWNMAVESSYAGGVATTVPILSGVGYRAVYPCTDHGADAEHSHSCAVVQKLVVLEPSDGGAVCYIVNVVPYEGAHDGGDTPAAHFAYGSGNVGFSGFAAYHLFDGTLSHIDGFDNGVLCGTALLGEDAAVSEITRNVKLFFEVSVGSKAGSGADGAYDNGFNPKYDICGMCYLRCGAAYDPTLGFDNMQDYNKNLANYAKHCTTCRQLKTDGKPGSVNRCQCTTPGGVKCSICGDVDCPPGRHVIADWLCAYCGILCDSRVDDRDTSIPRNWQKPMFINALKDRIPSRNLHLIQEDSYNVEGSFRNQGDEYLHNLVAPGESSEVLKERIRNRFIEMVTMYKDAGEQATSLGSAIHPLVDCYVPHQDRVNALAYYSYASFNDIGWVGRGAPMSGVAIRDMYNSIMNLPKYPSAAQVGTLFDVWYLNIQKNDY